MGFEKKTVQAIMKAGKECHSKCDVKKAVAQKSESFSLVEVKPTSVEGDDAAAECQESCMGTCMSKTRDSILASNPMLQEIMKAGKECHDECEVNKVVAQKSMDFSLAEGKPTSAEEKPASLEGDGGDESQNKCINACMKKKRGSMLAAGKGGKGKNGKKGRKYDFRKTPKKGKQK